MSFLSKFPLIKLISTRNYVNKAHENKILLISYINYLIFLMGGYMTFKPLDGILSKRYRQMLAVLYHIA